MKIENILIGGVIGGVIAYLILKPKTTAAKTANASGYDKRDEQLSNHFAEELTKAQAKFVDFNAQGDNFSNPNISGVPIHAGFSYPEKELFQMSPYKH